MSERERVCVRVCVHMRYSVYVCVCISYSPSASVTSSNMILDLCYNRQRLATLAYTRSV